MPPPERRATDTPKSYAALCDYAGLGPGRSLEKLVQVYTSSGIAKPPTKHRATLGVWSSAHDWQARVAAYDAQLLADEEAARSAIRQQRRLELEEQDWTTGSDLRRACEAILLEMPRFLRHTETEVTQGGELVKVITLALKAGPGELARALELASKLQRLSVGEATDIHKLVESELGAVLDRLRDNLSTEEYARVVAVIAG